MNHLLLIFNANIDILAEKVKEVNEYFLLDLLWFFIGQILALFLPCQLDSIMLLKLQKKSPLAEEVEAVLSS